MHLWRTEASTPFDHQPIPQRELLGLRPLRPEDFPALYSVASDPHIWEQHPSKDRYKQEVFRGFFREALDSRGALIAIDARDGQVIGSSRFSGYDPEHSEIEIGWTFLSRFHWCGRYNGEMKQLMLRHAFQFVQRVIFLVGPEMCARSGPWKKSAPCGWDRVLTRMAETALCTASRRRCETLPLFLAYEFGKTLL